MRSLNDKMLCLALALLVGFSPVQGALASVMKAPSQDMSMHHQMMGQHDSKDAMDPEQQRPLCQQHMGDKDCPSHTGSSNHCAGCVVGILLPPTINFSPILLLSFRPSNDGFSSQHTTSLYRPPRA